MIEIFAKIGTKERIAINTSGIIRKHDILPYLNARFGGDWVSVQDLKTYQAIRFEADKVYKGFDGNPANDYCGNLIDLTYPAEGYLKS